jgi:hypothetical protein
VVRGTKGKRIEQSFCPCSKNAILQILKNPGAYAIRYKNIRIAHITTFPYAIHFLTEDNTIIITAIIYDRRDPAITMKRI